MQLTIFYSRVVLQWDVGGREWDAHYFFAKLEDLNYEI